MGKTKALVIGEKIIFVLLVLFPFGQLIRFGINIFGRSIVVQPIDVVAGMAVLLVVFSSLKRPTQIAFGAFFVVLIFSFIYSLTFFKVADLFPGVLYLLRLVAYFCLFVLAWNLSTQRKNFRDLILNALLFESVVIAILGWFQYFKFSDLRALIYLGWDDHLYRLVSTLLDPGFTGIIIGLGFLISLAKILTNRKKIFGLALVFLLVTLAFTYARAAYLSLLAGSLMVLYLQKKIRVFVLIFIGLILLIIFLPRPSSEGVKLERLSSIYPRLANYKESIEIIKRSPLFGVGYNNLCAAKVKYLGLESEDSHSCSGLDSSILMLLATVGVVGFIIFSKLIFGLWNHASEDIFGVLFKSSLIAVFIHSLFTNSLFYPWVLAWMSLLLAASFRESSSP